MKKMLIIASLAFTAAACMALPSFAAGSEDERQDCTSDAFRLCGQYIPDTKAITACMIKQKAKLSPACRKHFH